MENTCRYVVNALGKGGETYYTKCKDKHELKNWININKEKLIMNELKIVDKNGIRFLNWLSSRKFFKL